MYFSFCGERYISEWAIAMIGRRCNRFSISSQKIPEVQKPQAVLGFGSTSYVCAWSQ
ncbi:hypothetical protein [Nostoc sp.]